MHLLLKDADRMGVTATCPSLTLASCTLPSVPRTGEEKAPDAQAASSEEAPLPGLFGDNDDWDQLLSGIGSTPLSALQLSWSPPPTPKSVLPTGKRVFALSPDFALTLTDIALVSARDIMIDFFVDSREQRSEFLFPSL